MTSISKKAGRGPGAVAARKKSKGKGKKGNGQQAIGSGKKPGVEAKTEHRKSAVKLVDSHGEKREGGAISLGMQLLMVSHELETIDWLLQAVPDVEHDVDQPPWARRRSPDRKPGDECADYLAQWAMDEFGVDLDANDQKLDELRAQTPSISGMCAALSTLIDAARWRIRRLERLMSLAGLAIK